MTFIGLFENKHQSQKEGLGRWAEGEENCPVDGPLEHNYNRSYNERPWLLFEWDEQKSKENLTKHGLSFEDAETVFLGPCITFEDQRRDYGEERFVTLGRLEGRTVVIAHTPRGANTRIISMRKANSREQETYQKRLGTT